MAIVVNLDVMLARRKMSVTELAQQIGITMANISILKNGRARAIRFSTLDAICATLDCQPGDLLEYRAEADLGDAADTLFRNQAPYAPDGGSIPPAPLS